MSTDMSFIEDTYRAAVDRMTPAEKIARMHGYFDWMRDLYARQISAEREGLSEDQLKWEVALRIYGSDRRVKALIENRLRDVHR